MVEISKAAAEDLEWLALQLKEFAVSYGTKKPLFGPEQYAKEFLENLIANHVLLIARRNGERVGLIAGIKAPHMFNPSLTLLSEIFWWVSASARGSRVGLNLLDAFIDAGKGIADWISICVHDVDAELPNAFRVRGMVPMEQSFLLEVA